MFTELRLLLYIDCETSSYNLDYSCSLLLPGYIPVLDPAECGLIKGCKADPASHRIQTHYPRVQNPTL